MDSGRIMEATSEQCGDQDITSPSKSSSSKRKRLVQWFLEHDGYLDESLQLTHDQKSGQHFRTKNGLIASQKSATVLCRCPLSLSLSLLSISTTAPHRIRQCEDESICRHLHDVSNATKNYFFLCEQRLLGDRSFWAPYIDTLPTETVMTTPLWFDDEDKNWLLGTNIHINPPESSGLVLRQEMWQEEWEKGVKILNGAGADVQAFSWELFLWAATIFSSRSFTSNILGDKMLSEAKKAGQAMGNFALLYPVLDSFNHKFGAKVLWDINNGDFELSTTESVSEGDEVFNNYAPKSNEELLMGYGFCMESNPCDVVALRMSKPPPPVYALLREQFPSRYTSAGWSDEAANFFIRGSGHYTGGYAHGEDGSHLRGLPPELVGTIKLILTYSSEQQGQALNPEHVEPAAVETIYERSVEKYLGIKKWDTKLEDGPKNDKQKFAKLYRDGQLEILEEVIHELQSYLDQF